MQYLFFSLYAFQIEIRITLKDDFIKSIDWFDFKGQQRKVATPGQNKKHYLAGALRS